MKILVTGASGFIGSNLISRLAVAGHEVIALARTLPGESESGISWIEADLGSAEWDPVATLPSAVDAAIHLAQSKRYREFPDEAADIFEVNTAATFRLLDYARKAGASHFINASSGSVYSGQNRDRLVEETTISPSDFSGSPLGFYCATKLCGEALVEAYRTQFVSTASLRIFAPYGPGGDASLVNRMVERAAAGEAIQIQGNPGLTFNPIHVDDICGAISTLLESREPIGALNLAGGEIVSLTDLVTLAGAQAGKPVKIEYTDSDPPAGTRLVAGIEMLKAIGAKPRIDLAEGIASLLGRD